MRKYFLIAVIFFISSDIFSQELRCQVNVNSQQIQGTNKLVYQAMRNEIFKFMNDRAWTDHLYDIDERIDCTFFFNITEQVSSDEFRATLTISAKRPVYGSSYTTTLINHRDTDIRFKFREFEPLIFNETAHTSNLTSLLAFYAYIIIGLDYDTFSPMGGSQFFQKAEVIVDNAQNASEAGWKAFESLNNRYHLAENLNNPIFSPLRDCLYSYHRLGMDLLTDRENEARANIAEGLQTLKQIHTSKPLSFLLQIFFTAKSDEIVYIFGKSFPDEKSRIVNLLTEIDPANIQKYEGLTKK